MEGREVTPRSTFWVSFEKRGEPFGLYAPSGVPRGQTATPFGATEGVRAGCPLRGPVRDPLRDPLRDAKRDARSRVPRGMRSAMRNATKRDARFRVPRGMRSVTKHDGARSPQGR